MVRALERCFFGNVLREEGKIFSLKIKKGKRLPNCVVQVKDEDLKRKPERPAPDLETDESLAEQLRKDAEDREAAEADKISAVEEAVAEATAAAEDKAKKVAEAHAKALAKATGKAK